MKLLSGNSNRTLSQAIANHLDMPLTKAQVKRFADNEVFAVIEENVRGEDVFVIQSTSAPANDNLMELLICIDALVRASARRITAVMPYFGYARQDRKTGGRTPISAKLVANMITRAGADPALVTEWLYQRRARRALNELGELLRRIEVSEDGAVAWLPVPSGLVSEEFMAAEDVVTYPRSIGGVKVAVLLREEPAGRVKVSLRGKGEVPVNKIAGRFGGGGHENAAGCSMPGSLDEVTSTVLAAVREALAAPAR